MDIYKRLNFVIGTVIKNPEMLNFFRYYLKTKKMCNHVVGKMRYLSRYVPDQFKTQQMCDKAFIENGRTLKSVRYCYKNQEMCNADNY